MTSLSIVKLFHLWGLIMGMGGAMLADYTVFRHAILRPVRRQTLDRMQLLSRIVIVGLALLWVTGIALVKLRAVGDPNYLNNPKLWSKISIVLVLTANGIIIHCLALPRLAKSYGFRLFDNAGKAEVAILTLVAAISGVSWLVPFVLGTASELNYTTPASEIMSVYGLLILAAWIGFYAFITMLPLLRNQFATRPVLNVSVLPLLSSHRAPHIARATPVPRKRLDFALGG